MSETTVEQRTAALPADDGVIKEALADLDTKLAAWLATVNAGQALPQDGDNGSAAATERSTRLEPAPAAGTDREQGSAARPGSKLFQGQIPAPVAAGRAQQTSELPVPRATEDSVSTEDAEDDEVLLASLDAETASAIQVKRRLAGNTKSTRELLEEVRSEPTPARAPGSQRTRWWRRADERHDG